MLEVILRNQVRFNNKALNVEKIFYSIIGLRNLTCMNGGFFFCAITIFFLLVYCAVWLVCSSLIFSGHVARLMML